MVLLCSRLDKMEKQARSGSVNKCDQPKNETASEADTDWNEVESEVFLANVERKSVDGNGKFV